ncbi:hydrolase [Actinoalloteichus sp. AHMU CJ021]|uniref:Glycosyl hydrolases family 16 n=1 Tax=Actinoalloteichus caeruleus DSM 43889 TaxID=1120930 RepID=A0ABT1JDY1_ACTCY|nr:glycoside hydrolase family 16 protein [Actinoalloteichus caeruleus]AUS81328.1 hydrolase [Actinoalloteichus sp. AHMU CJ021]MCP2330710.1 Glycosyl hydrolases family 16 [Actinoalloteichus caeruleus DSM 43889]
MPLGTGRSARRRHLPALVALAGAVALPVGLLPALGGTATAGAEAAEAPTQVLFDDFDYTSHTDPRLRERGWSVRNYPGGPGIGGDTWSAANISFRSEGAGAVLRLEATTDGTVAGTSQAQINTQRRFHHGTYAARVRFTDTPVSGPDGDQVLQTFYTITPLRWDYDPEYGELDFEYLPNGGWGQPSSALFLTSWDTYRPDPWDARNESTVRPGSLEGWHDLVVQADGGTRTIRYYLDGQLVAEHGGPNYPASRMSIDFNQWFIPEGFVGSSASRTYEQEVDWVYHAKDEILSPAEVAAQVAAQRAAGIPHLDTITE